MKKIQAFIDLLAMEFLATDPSSNEDEARQILKAYFDKTHQILLGPYPGKSADPHVIDRHRLIGFLELTVTLLRGIGAGDDLFNKLMTFSAKLRDLDRGVHSPIFMAHKLSNSPPDSSAIWRLRTMLAIATDYLKRAGELERATAPLADAVRTVARTPGMKRLLSKQAISPEASVKKWRGNLHRGKVTNEIARMAWKASREKLASIDGPQGFRDEAALLIAIVRDELR